MQSAHKVKILLTISLILLPNILALFKFDIIQCEVFEKSIGEVQICNITANGRKTFASIRIKLNTRLTQAKVHTELKRKGNDWQPFYLNADIDVCNFLLNRKKYTLISKLYDFVEMYTNINQTCPFEKDAFMTLDSMEVSELSFTKVFPINFGQYGIFTKWYMNKKYFGTLNVTVSYMH